MQLGLSLFCYAFSPTGEAEYLYPTSYDWPSEAPFFSLLDHRVTNIPLRGEKNPLLQVVSHPFHLHGFILQQNYLHMCWKITNLWLPRENSACGTWGMQKHMSTCSSLRLQTSLLERPDASQSSFLFLCPLPVSAFCDNMLLFLRFSKTKKKVAFFYYGRKCLSGISRRKQLYV